MQSVALFDRTKTPTYANLSSVILVRDVATDYVCTDLRARSCLCGEETMSLCPSRWAASGTTVQTTSIDATISAGIHSYASQALEKRTIDAIAERPMA